MFSFHLESWAAIAPGLETREEWQQWLRQPTALDEPLGKISLPDIPAMLRRRFDTLGKCAMSVAMPMVAGIDAIPSIFASRHGDTELSLSLLEGIAREEPMSPTSFSLAVHNAVGGLFSIARKDCSALTAIAAMDGLVLQTLFEAIGQMNENPRVLCVIYDVPLPDFYRRHCHENDVEFPFAIALIMNRGDGQPMRLEPVETAVQAGAGPGDTDPMRLLALLSGLSAETLLRQNSKAWKIARVAD